MRKLQSLTLVLILQGCALLQNDEAREPATKEHAASALAALHQTYETSGRHHGCQTECFVNFVDLLTGRNSAFKSTPRDTSATFSLSVRDSEHLVVRSYLGARLVEELVLRGYVNRHGYFDLPVTHATNGKPPWSWSRDYFDVALRADTTGELAMMVRTGGTHYYLIWPYSYGDTRAYTFRPVSRNR